MPNSVDEKHSPSEFYCPGETNYQSATCQGEDNDAGTKQQQKQPRKSVFWSFLQSQKKLRFNKAI